MYLMLLTWLGMMIADAYQEEEAKMFNPNDLKKGSYLIHPKFGNRYKITAYDHDHDMIMYENRNGLRFEISISKVASSGYEIREEA